jgi:fumarate hydratase class II
MRQVVAEHPLNSKGVTVSRTEYDSFGAIEVPDQSLWGAQTQRSLENFKISTERMPVEVIRAMVLVIRASARVNADRHHCSG